MRLKQISMSQGSQRFHVETLFSVAQLAQLIPRCQPPCISIPCQRHMQRYEKSPGIKQARNQCGTPWGWRVFWERSKNFETMPNNFKLRPAHFFRSGEKFCRRVLAWYQTHWTLLLVYTKHECRQKVCQLYLCNKDARSLHKGANFRENHGEWPASRVEKHTSTNVLYNVPRQNQTFYGHTLVHVVVSN